MYRTMKKQKGFTLIELMIVVAIIGILAAVAIPAFMEYMRKGKKSEASVQLNRLAKASKAYYVEQSGYPPVDEPSIPGDSCAVATRTISGVEVPAKMWHTTEFVPAGSTSAFTVLEFQLEENFRFSYDYTFTAGPPNSYVANATADLDCDGGGSTTVTARGTVVNGQPAVDITSTGND